MPNLQSSLKTKPALPPSFPRRRESWRGLSKGLFYQNIAEQQSRTTNRIPACAGMTVFAAFQTASFAKIGRRSDS
ncbi:DNA processing SMF protein [Neisseria bacilliformis ATCC BAA-1200]|uniref:DNA processing SMF protein n=1 Tax=Neisseria bacilliformis ATCC BAA-1200 TaxID=888742 RepID=F2BAH4_9NEIS|nr:DNA processing SMF protein [Neisseria bacilliformis ATCC BAA-1200]